MASSFGSGPVSPLSPWSASTSTGSYRAATLRAAAIALVLLGILIAIVVF